MPDSSESVPLDEQQRPMQLPPAFETFVGRIRSDKKKLMKDKAFGQSADQLRGFIGTFIYPRITEQVKLFASAVFETYSLAASNAEGLRRLHSFVTEELEHIRNELDDMDSDRRGVNPAVMDEFQQAFYALGTILKEKLAEDEDAQAAYNRCGELLSEMVLDLMGSSGDDYPDDDEDDDEGDSEGDTPVDDDDGEKKEEPPEEEPPESDGGE
jgi:hypothetical protein